MVGAVRRAATRMVAGIASPNPRNTAQITAVRPEHGRGGERKHRTRKVRLPFPCGDTCLSGRSARHAGMADARRGATTGPQPHG